MSSSDLVDIFTKDSDIHFYVICTVGTRLSFFKSMESNIPWGQSNSIGQYLKRRELHSPTDELTRECPFVRLSRTLLTGDLIFSI